MRVQSARPTKIAPGQNRAGVSHSAVVVGLAVMVLFAGLIPPALLTMQQAAADHRSMFHHRHGLDSSRCNSAACPLPFFHVPIYVSPVVPNTYYLPNGWVYPQPRYDSYAAIAYSIGTGSWGYAQNHYTQSAAEAAALASCNAVDCRVMVWSRNSCCALAVGDQGRYGYGWDSHRSNAEAAALNECRQRTSNCKIVCWTCARR